VSRELEDLIDLDGLSFEEQARLRRVHGLILFAGPPEELPAHLLAPPPRGVDAPCWRCSPRRRSRPPASAPAT
jgi:hypothetical protein